MRNLRTRKAYRPALAVLALCLVFAVVMALASEKAVWPDPSGTDVRTNGKLIIDCSHMDQGYVMARISESTSHAMKLRVTFKGGQLMYDINNDGDFETFPLQLGSGSYEFSLFENVKGSKFSAEGKITLSVELEDEYAAFLVPNQYVCYDEESEVVKKSDEICAGKTTDREIYDTVCNFMASEFQYDFVRATTISSGTLPEVDACYAKRSGICQDMAAVMVCMLRTQGIPAKLVIGYADQYYHAWTTAVVDGEEIFFDPTAAIGCINASRYSIERVY